MIPICTHDFPHANLFNPSRIACRRKAHEVEADDNQEDDSAGEEQVVYDAVISMHEGIDADGFQKETLEREEIHPPGRFRRVRVVCVDQRG